MESIIHIDGLKRHYMMGDTLVAALDDVKLDVNPGDFLMIVGSSGSGKSTLLAAVLGEVSCIQGIVSVYHQSFL